MAISFQTFFGGKGANQAVAAARLGAAVTMIGKVGTDSFGPELLQGLKSAGVRTNCVRRAAGSSGVALITTDRDGQNSIVVVPGANGQMNPDDLDRYRSRIENAAIVLAQLEIPMATVEHLATITSKAGVPLMLDPAPATRLSRKLLRSVTWLTPNETESAALLGDAGENRGVDAIADRILSLGVRNVVLKLRREGCLSRWKRYSASCCEGLQSKTGRHHCRRRCIQWSVCDGACAWHECGGCCAIRLRRSRDIRYARRSTTLHAVLQRGRSIPATAALKLAMPFVRLTHQ